MSRRVRLVCFDLGNTLVRYFGAAEFPALRDDAVKRVAALLRRQGWEVPGSSTLVPRVAAEDYEASDFAVRPLEQRLTRIFFGEGVQPDPRLLEEMCGEFVAPLLERGRRFPDALPVLQALRGQGLATAVVSNTPWGSPAPPWRSDLSRHALSESLDFTVFCRDLGWRKPSPRIFRHVLALAGVVPEEALFVGDHPVWDVEGPRACGMRAVLLVREGSSPGGAISSLEELPELV